MFASSKNPKTAGRHSTPPRFHTGPSAPHSKEASIANSTPRPNRTPVKKTQPTKLNTRVNPPNAKRTHNQSTTRSAISKPAKGNATRTNKQVTHGNINPLKSHNVDDHRVAGVIIASISAPTSRLWCIILLCVNEQRYCYAHDWNPSVSEGIRSLASSVVVNPRDRQRSRQWNAT